jgi:hypothetical protein
MGDWIHRLREARADGATGFDETAEDAEQGHMSAADLARQRMGGDAGADEGAERWVSSVSVSGQGEARVRISITIDLGPSGVPPSKSAQLKILGGELIPGTRFDVSWDGKSCSATLEVEEQAARIFHASALGKLVAHFDKWPEERPPARREP